MIWLLQNCAGSFPTATPVKNNRIHLTSMTLPKVSMNQVLLGKEGGWGPGKMVQKKMPAISSP